MYKNNISKITNCQCVALHGCHLAKSRLPVTPSSLKITIITKDMQYTLCGITTQYNRRIINVKLLILLDITKIVTKYNVNYYRYVLMLKM